jgi:hypothetical protein
VKIAYVGNFAAEHSTENHVARALEHNDHTVVRLPEQGRNWGRLKTDTRGADLFLWTRTAGYDPDNLDQQRKALKGLSIPTVGFHLDRWWGLDRESAVYASPFFDLDIVFTADGGHDTQWQEAGVNHVWSPPAVSLGEAQVGTPRDEWRTKVGFVGSWKHYHREWPQRQQLIKWAGRTYGNKFRAFPPAGQPAIRGKALQDLYASIDVVIGDSCLTGSPANYWSDRIPETLGRGGFLIHPKVDGLEDQFPPTTLVTVALGDWRSWKAVVDHYLHAPDDRRRLAEAGRLHVLEHHTYEVRMTQVLDRVKAEGLL